MKNKCEIRGCKNNVMSCGVSNGKKRYKKICCKHHWEKCGTLEKKRKYAKEYKAKNRIKYLVKQYGITESDYEKMFSEQNGKCATCFDSVSLNIDHNHQTGKVRGLLCFRCNACLGFLKEDVGLMNNLIKYIQNYEKN